MSLKWHRVCWPPSYTFIYVYIYSELHHLYIHLCNIWYQTFHIFAIIMYLIGYSPCWEGGIILPAVEWLFSIVATNLAMTWKTWPACVLAGACTSYANLRRIFLAHGHVDCAHRLPISRPSQGGWQRRGQHLNIWQSTFLKNYGFKTNLRILSGAFSCVWNCIHIFIHTGIYIYTYR